MPNKTLSAHTGHPPKPTAPPQSSTSSSSSSSSPLPEIPPEKRRRRGRPRRTPIDATSPSSQVANVSTSSATPSRQKESPSRVTLPAVSAAPSPNYTASTSVKESPAAIPSTSTRRIASPSPHGSSRSSSPQPKPSIKAKGKSRSTYWKPGEDYVALAKQQRQHEEAQQLTCQGCRVSLTTFLLLISDREALITFLVRHGVIKRSLACAKCHQKCLLNTRHLSFRCSRQRTMYLHKRRKKRQERCNFHRTALKDTWFSRSSLSLEEVCHITVSFLLNLPPRHATLKNELGCSSVTIVKWLSYVREALQADIRRREGGQERKLGGAGIIVEVGKIEIHKRKANHGSVTEGQWVLGGVERGTDEFFLVPVLEQTEGTLVQLIQKHVEPGTTVITNGWEGYNNLEERGFHHLTENHSNSAHTQTIKRMWREVRAHIPWYGQRRECLSSYLAEFVWKKRFSSLDRIHEFFIGAGHLFPGPQAESPEPTSESQLSPILGVGKSSESHVTPFPNPDATTESLVTSPAQVPQVKAVESPDASGVRATTDASSSEMADPHTPNALDSHKESRSSGN